MLRRVFLMLWAKRESTFEDKWGHYVSIHNAAAKRGTVDAREYSAWRDVKISFARVEAYVRHRLRGG